MSLFGLLSLGEGFLSLGEGFLSGAVEEEPEDEDGSMIGYTHKGGGTIVVLILVSFSSKF